MGLTLARLVAGALEAYVTVGAVAALFLLGHRVERLDPVLSRSPLAVRGLLFPGMLALWPIFLRRRLLGRLAPEERNPHRDRASRSAS
jgi:hypothetical protein